MIRKFIHNSMHLVDLIIKRPGDLNAVQVICSSIIPDHNAMIFWNRTFGAVVPPIVDISNFKKCTQRVIITQCLNCVN